MTEIWLSIPAWEDKYQVSDHGRVRNKTKILKPQLRTDGYYMVELWRNGRRKTGKIHTLVALAFLGPRPPELEVCHRDDNKKNNVLSNLYYGPHQGNMTEAVRNGVHPQARKTHCPAQHEYTEENTYTSPDNRRHCRTCMRATQQRYHQRKLKR